MAMYPSVKVGGGTTTYTSHIYKGAVTVDTTNKRYIGRSKNDILGHKAFAVISTSGNFVFMPAWDWDLVQYIKNNFYVTSNWDTVNVLFFSSVNIDFSLYTEVDPVAGNLYVFD